MRIRVSLIRFLLEAGLLLHRRQFANAAGELRAEVDPLVREAYGSDLAELVT